MKKRTIRKTAAVMAAAMTIASVSPCALVFAEKAETSSSSAKKQDEKLAAAIEVARSRVNIPAEYSEFTYSKRTYNAKEYYQLNWKMNSETSTDSNSISISVYNDTIIEYSYYDPKYQEWNDRSFATLTKTQLMNAAKKAVLVFNPEFEGHIGIDDNMQFSLSRKTVEVSYVRKENNIEMRDQGGYVNIDKHTGDVIRYKANWWEDSTYQDPSEAHSKDEILKDYTENHPLTLTYRISERNGKKQANLVYTSAEAEYDAITGKPSTRQDDLADASNTSNYSLGETIEYEYEEDAVEEEDAGYGYTNKVVFTESEKNSLLESGQYYSKKDAVELLKKDKYLGLTDEYNLEYADFSKNTDSPSGYVWYFSFIISDNDTYRSMSVSMDAESGKIISFDKYDSKMYLSSKNVNTKKANALGDSVIEYYLPDISKEYRPNKSNTEGKTSKNSRYLIYTRYVNDIPVIGDCIYVTVGADGDVLGFSYNYTDIKFPEPKVMSEKDAFKSLFSQTDIPLEYKGFIKPNGKTKTYLVYSIPCVYLNAKTGRVCDINGNASTTKKNKDKSCPYTDISKNWANKYITKLYEYGISLDTENNMFRPDDYITEREFAVLLDKVTYNGVCYMLYGDYAYDPTSRIGTSPLTRRDGAKLIVLSYGGKDFAELKGIYKSPFKDVSDSSDYAGYISIAYALGAVKAEANGKFNPESKVTRAYAMYMLYNILSK